MHIVPGERRDVFFLFSLTFTYTAKNAQVATRLLKSRNNLLQQAHIRMRSHGLRLFVDDKSVASTHVKISQLVASLQTSR